MQHLVTTRATYLKNNPITFNEYRFIQYRVFSFFHDLENDKRAAASYGYEERIHI